MVAPHTCRSWLASEGGLTADLCFVDRVHIHCCGNGHLGFRPYGESLWQTPQRNQRSCPTIRPLAGARGALTPALLRGPAAIGHPWPRAAIPASMPGCPLRNACVRPLEMGQVDQEQKPKQSQSQSQANTCGSEPAREKPENTAGGQVPRVIVDDHRRQASSYRRLLLWLWLWLWLLILIFLPHREAEWRFCAVGNPAWMPG
jgi:hypothetical protein